MNRDRRSFIRTLSTAGLLLPFADQMLGKVASAATPTGVAARTLFVYYPNGCRPDTWHSTDQSATGGNFQLNAATSPLEPYKNQLNLFRNLIIKSDKGPAEEIGHGDGTKAIMTGNGSGGSSIDTELGLFSQSQYKTKYDLIRLGVQSQAQADGPSFNRQGSALTPEPAPQAAYDKYLAGIVGGGGSSSSETDPAIARRKQVLETMLADLNVLRGRELTALSGVEKAKLDAHSDVLDQLKLRLESNLNGGNAVDVNPQFDDSKINDIKLLPRLVRAQMNILVQSMAAGLTRVGSLQFGYHTTDMILDYLEFDERNGLEKLLEYPAGNMGSSAQHRWHSVSHFNDDSTKVQNYWFNYQMAYLLSLLKAQPDPDLAGKTMLDTSLVVVCSEIANGSTHNGGDPGIYVAGGGNGSIKTGQILNYSSNRPVADLWLSMAKAMGASWASFGESRGALTEFLS